MKNNNSRLSITSLTESERARVKRAAEGAWRMARSIEYRTKEYAVDEQPMVTKFIEDLKFTQAFIDVLLDELIEKHGLPPELKNTDGEYLRAARLMATGIKEARRVS